MFNIPDYRFDLTRLLLPAGHDMLQAVDIDRIPRRQPMASDTGNRLKWPLIVAATLVVLRIVLEHLGAPESINNLLGVAWLHVLVPFYLAYQIQSAGSDRPYRALFKDLFLYTLYTRLMVLVTYWMAYLWQWQSPRFLLARGGNVGEGIGPFQGYPGDSGAQPGGLDRDGHGRRHGPGLRPAPHQGARKQDRRR